MLNLGLDIARSGLAASGGQAAVVSRNIANAGNSLASRKIANAITGQGGGVVIASITRATNDALTKSLQSAISSAAGQNAIAEALDRIDATINDPASDSSPAAKLAALQSALQVYSNSPDNPTLGAVAIDQAKRLASSLNDATETIQNVRNQADADIASSVSTVNDLLKKFEALNSQIVQGSRNATDITDALDSRDELARKIAEEIGIRTVVRADNDMAIFTDSGLTLFDTVPRAVSFVRSVALTPGTAGQPVYVDGVPVTGNNALMSVESGRISGLAAVRDDYSVSYQRQMDEIARGLIEAFAEHDQSIIPTLPDIPGLFTHAGAPAVPLTGVVMDGLAGSIAVNPSVDPASGGNFRLLRDGSIGDPGNPAYTYNTAGSAGFSDRILELIENISASRAFDTSTGLGSPSSLETAASASAGWLGASRQRALADAEYRTTLMERTHEALSRSTGVNLDEEMTSLLEIERAYQTSSKVLTVIDSMFRTLLNAT